MNQQQQEQPMSIHDPAFRAALRDARRIYRGAGQPHWTGTPYLPPALAVFLARAACPKGYNDFTADLLAKLLADQPVTVRFAREYSVAVYVRGGVAALGVVADRARRARVDEVNLLANSELRVWWD